MTAPKATILAVDDDPALLKLLSMMLTMEGYKVLEAESGEKALALLATSTPVLSHNKGGNGIGRQSAPMCMRIM